MDKAELRGRLCAWLRAIPADQKDHKSRRACRGLVSSRPFQQASVAMMFLSMPDEIDTTAAIVAAWQRGMTVVAPCVDWDRRTMTPVVIESLDRDIAMERGGLRNPQGGRAMEVERIDLVVAPGLGFDMRGHRLGRGGGFYDRFFADGHLGAVRCGLCFQEQVVEAVPVTTEDQAVDWLVTDEQVICMQDRKGV